MPSKCVISEILIRFYIDKDQVIDFPNNSCIRVAFLVGVSLSLCLSLSFSMLRFLATSAHRKFEINYTIFLFLTIPIEKEVDVIWKCVCVCVLHFVVSKRNIDNGNTNATFLFLHILRLTLIQSMCAVEKKRKDFHRWLCLLNALWSLNTFASSSARHPPKMLPFWFQGIMHSIQSSTMTVTWYRVHTHTHTSCSVDVYCGHGEGKKDWKLMQLTCYNLQSSLKIACTLAKWVCVRAFTSWNKRRNHWYRLVRKVAVYWLHSKYESHHHYSLWSCELRTVENIIQNMKPTIAINAMSERWKTFTQYLMNLKPISHPMTPSSMSLSFILSFCAIIKFCRQWLLMHIHSCQKKRKEYICIFIPFYVSAR